MADDVVTQMVQDPQFQQLPIGEMRKALSTHDAMFQNADDNAIRGFVQAHQKTPSQPQQQPGAFSRLGQSFGIPQSMQGFQSAAPQSVSDALDMVTPGGIATKLIQNYASTAGQGFKQGYQEAGEADQLRKQGAISTKQAIGKTASAALNATVNAIPVVGPTAVSMGEDVSRRNYAGAAGSGLGIATQILAPELMRRAGAALPSKENAGALFNQASAAAGANAIDVSRPGDIALQMREAAQSGGKLPKVVRDFITRATDPNRGPITYDEARQFYQNAGNLAVNERNGLNASAQRLLNQFRASLGASIQDAANQAGVGPQYSGAMKQYRQAAKLSDVGDFAKEKVVPALAKGAAGAIGAGAIGGPLYYLWKKYLSE